MKTALLAFLIVGCIGPQPSAPTPIVGDGEVQCDETTATCQQAAERRCPKGYQVVEADKGRRSHDIGFKDPNAPPVYVEHFTWTIHCR